MAMGVSKNEAVLFLGVLILQDSRILGCGSFDIFIFGIGKGRHI